ncbi:MAG: DNA polymerase III subunit [Minicystis sp.]
MPFSHILGQDAAIATLKSALTRGRVHHAYRFEGPDGTGKEMAAFALAQALVCTGGEVFGCGKCDACRRAITISNDAPRVPLHPDVTLVEKGLYPPETIGKKDTEKSDISIHQIRTIVLAHASYPPHEGRARVFIIRRAEELNPSAANALLKTLEEPRQGTHFILLTARADRLLNTIRSRSLPVRFGPLPDEVVRGILREKGVPAERQELAIELGAGSASLSLELADEERTAARDAFVAGVLGAVDARDLAPAVALSENVDKDKAALRDDLRALAAVLARRARQDVGGAPRAALVAARRYEVVAKAVVSLERNASPGLTMISLVQEMRAATGF